MTRKPTKTTRLDAEAPQPQGTLARGLVVLDHLRTATQSRSLNEIAGATGLDNSTVHRMLKTLEEAGYVIRTRGRAYVASPKALSPLPLIHPLKQLRREAQPVLHELARELGETVVLVVYLDVERMVVEIAQTSGSLMPYYDTWLHGPMHCSGAGKALLLKLDPERRRAILGPEPYRQLAPRSLTTWDDLSSNLAIAAERGYVVARDEHHVGLTAIGANVGDWQGEPVGCLVVTGHSRGFDEARIAATGESLCRSAGILRFQAPSLKAWAHFLET